MVKYHGSVSYLAGTRYWCLWPSGLGTEQDDWRDSGDKNDSEHLFGHIPVQESSKRNRDYEETYQNEREHFHD